jgi:hypothetical protein
MNVMLFGSGAVTNTLMALFKNSDDVSLTLQSRHADHVRDGGVKLLHRGQEITVHPKDIKVLRNPADCFLVSPTVIINGRQLGGNYAEMFDACTKETQFIMCAQNGFSSQAMYREAQKYILQKPEREELIRGITGVDMSMFVKMSATEDRSKTVLQPGAKWVFGAFSLKDGSGTGLGGSSKVDAPTFEKVSSWVNWFRALSPADGTDDMVDVKTLPEAVTGKLTKTSNNIGGNYAAAIITRLVHLASQTTDAFHALTGPLPYGVLHEDYDLRGNLGHIMSDGQLAQLAVDIATVRDLSIRAVEEFYNLYSEQFKDVMTKEEVLEAAHLYWTEVDGATGQRVPSKHPPTHALAMFESRPSEPLLEAILETHSYAPALRALHEYHREVEKRTAMPISIRRDVGGG